MKTKLQVALEVLGKVSRKHGCYIPAQRAIEEIKAMPDENCGNCKFFSMREPDNYCASHGFPCWEPDDFCSRFEAKDKSK